MDAIKHLQKQLEIGKITRFAVVHIAFDVDFATQPSIQTVMASVVYQQQDRSGISPNHPVVARLLAELDNSKLRYSKPPKQYDLDLRWGFLFYDRFGKCIFSLLMHRLPMYANKSRDEGFLNGRYVNLNHNLGVWYGELLQKRRINPD